MHTNRRISPPFFRVVLIKQRRIQNCTEKKTPKTKPEKKKSPKLKCTKNPQRKSPDLKFSSESQMPKENSAVIVGANHGRGM